MPLNKKGTNIIILGDANLCADRWHFPKFVNKKFAKSLQNTLSRCGLKVADIGPTFQSDHLKIDDDIYGSALDHVYYSSALENKLVIKSLKNSALDHLPVVCEIPSIPKMLPFTHRINKRCLKNFSEESWNDCLDSQEWTLRTTENLFKALFHFQQPLGLLSL